MNTIDNVCDYIIFRIKSEDDNASLSNLKLQKLLYYTQAWNLAFNDGAEFFSNKFQAWIHGPVNREIYNRFKDSKTLYSEIRVEDIINPDFMSSISEEDKTHIDDVITAYAKFSGVELEHMTHKETPWIEARKGYKSYDRCEVEISNETMKNYYSKQYEEFSNS